MSTTSTPTWLLDGDLAMCPCGCIGRRKKTGYVEKTIKGSSQLLRQVIFSDESADRAGFLQRIDPRVKLVSLFVLLITAALVRNIPVLLAMYVATLALAAASAIPLGFFIKRVWLFIPIFTGIVVLPATLSIVTPGTIVFPLWTWHGVQQGITEQGLKAAGLIITRVALSISLVVLVTLTTPWVRLLAALRSLGVPRIFILVIGMAYRYIFLLLTSVTDMYDARRARSVGAERHDKTARAFVSATAGALVGKSHTLSEEVHQAMTARGYRGDAKTLHTFHLVALDYAYSVGVLMVCAFVLMGDRFVGR